MLNSRSLQHKTVKKNIIKAMDQAIHNSVSHVRNKNGDAFLAVRCFDCKDGINRFEFKNAKGENVAPIIGQAYLYPTHDTTMANLIYPKRAGKIITKIIYSFMLKDVKK